MFSTHIPNKLYARKNNPAVTAGIILRLSSFLMICESSITIKPIIAQSKKIGKTVKNVIMANITQKRGRILILSYKVKEIKPTIIVNIILSAK